jgi:alpha-N-arabinofuranosidase
MGLLEFLEWCEDLKMQPVLAVYAGYSLAQEHVDPGPSLEPYVQDALDEIEYVTGGTDTKWGAERAKDGHPAPFPLRYIEVGNEDGFDHSGSYDGRYAQFYRAIKQRYPDLEIIATTPVKGIKPDVLDEHFYMSAQESFSQAHHYDAADRNGVGHARGRSNTQPRSCPGRRRMAHRPRAQQRSHRYEQLRTALRQRQSRRHAVGARSHRL